MTAIIFLVACTQNDTGLTVNDISIEMNDNEFSGIETHTVSLMENDVITVDTQGNIFDIVIIDELGNPMPFFGNGMNGQFSGTIPSSSEYTITIEGSGSFRIFWE